MLKCCLVLFHLVWRSFPGKKYPEVCKTATDYLVISEAGFFNFHTAKIQNPAGCI